MDYFALRTGCRVSSPSKWTSRLEASVPAVVPSLRVTKRMTVAARLSVAQPPCSVMNDAA